MVTQKCTCFYIILQNMHFFKNLSLLCIITRYNGLEYCQKLFEIPLSVKKPMPVLFITPTTYRENPVTLIDYKKSVLIS